MKFKLFQRSFSKRYPSIMIMINNDLYQKVVIHDCYLIEKCNCCSCMYLFFLWCLLLSSRTNLWRHKQVSHRGISEPENYCNYIRLWNLNAHLYLDKENCIDCHSNRSQSITGESDGTLCKWANDVAISR